MEHRFKVGDQVRCVVPDPNTPTSKGWYKVSECFTNWNPDMIFEIVKLVTVNISGEKHLVNVKHTITSENPRFNFLEVCFEPANTFQDQVRKAVLTKESGIAQHVPINHSGQVIQQVEQTGNPVLITSLGNPSVVVLSYEEYQKLRGV